MQISWVPVYEWVIPIYQDRSPARYTTPVELPPVRSKINPICQNAADIGMGVDGDIQIDVCVGSKGQDIPYERASPKQNSSFLQRTRLWVRE